MLEALSTSYSNYIKLPMQLVQDIDNARHPAGGQIDFAYATILLSNARAIEDAWVEIKVELGKNECCRYQGPQANQAAPAHSPSGVAETPRRQLAPQPSPPPGHVPLDHPMRNRDQGCLQCVYC